MLFCLFADQFPLLTTKRVFFRGILEELLWFIKVRMMTQCIMRSLFISGENLNYSQKQQHDFPETEIVFNENRLTSPEHQKSPSIGSATENLLVLK